MQAEKSFHFGNEVFEPTREVFLMKREILRDIERDKHHSSAGMSIKIREKVR